MVTCQGSAPYHWNCGNPYWKSWNHHNDCKIMTMTANFTSSLQLMKPYINISQPSIVGIVSRFVRLPNLQRCTLCVPLIPSNAARNTPLANSTYVIVTSLHINPLYGADVHFQSHAPNNAALHILNRDTQNTPPPPLKRK